MATRPATPFARTRQVVVTRTFSGWFQSLATVAGKTRLASPERHGLRRIADLRYKAGDDPHHTLDLYEPLDATGPLPTVIYIHGGAFRALSKDTHWIFGLRFASQGWRVLSLNYRLAPKNPFPAALEDVAAAWTWMVDNADLHGFDLSRVALAGESAGANLSTALTIMTCFKRPEPFAQAVFSTGVTPVAVMPACGILQVHDPDSFVVGKPVRQIFADAIYNCCDGYLPAGATREETALASPLTLLEAGGMPARPLPPFFVPCGTADPVFADSPRLAAALRALEVPVIERHYAGESHSFHAYAWRRAAKECWSEMLGFASDHLARPEG